MISESALDFVRSRPIAMLATRDRDKHPSLHECLIAGVEPDHVIGMVPEHLARNLEANVADNGDAALVVSRSPGDHRSVQLKGRITHIEGARARPEQLVEVRERLTPMFQVLMPEVPVDRVLDKMLGQRMFRIRLEVAAEFDQTPGPNAGRSVTGGA